MGNRALTVGPGSRHVGHAATLSVDVILRQLNATNADVEGIIFSAVNFLGAIGALSPMPFWAQVEQSPL